MGKRRFWAHVQGDESTEASRGGSRHISSHTRGWDLGVKVHGMCHTEKTNEFTVEITGGSNNPSKVVHVFRVFETEEGTIHIETSDRDRAIYDRELNPLVTFHQH